MRNRTLNKTDYNKMGDIEPIPITTNVPYRIEKWKLYKTDKRKK